MTALRARSRRGCAGQSLTETVLLLPLFLLAAFLIIQIGHLGVGLALVNYGAASVARLAVQQNGYNGGDAEAKMKGILLPGLKLTKMSHKSDGDDVTPNITVTACAELPAYPFVGEFLNKALRAKDESSDCAQGKPFGPILLKAPSPYHFVIRGEASARMNYKAKP